MGVLHLVNRPSALAQCLERVGQGDVVLLLEGGVYAALRGDAFAPSLHEALRRVSVHALIPDLAARGITEDEVLDGIGLVDYAGFVALSVAHAPIQSWF